MQKQISIKSQTESQYQFGTKNLICYKNVSSTVCPAHCKGTGYRVSSNRAKRQLLSNNEIFILFQGIVDSVFCKCPEDTETVNATDSTSGFFSKFLGNPCSRKSPKYNSPRCEDLRRVN